MLSSYFFKLSHSLLICGIYLAFKFNIFIPDPFSEMCEPARTSWDGFNISLNLDNGTTNFFGFHPHYSTVHCAFFKISISWIYKFSHFSIFTIVSLHSLWSRLTYSSLNFLFLFLTVLYCCFINSELKTNGMITHAQMKLINIHISP